MLAGFESLVPADARPGKKAPETGGPLDLTIERLSIDIGGRHASAIAVNDTVPGPLVRLREGQDAVIRVTNQLAHESASIHWHGLLVPFRMDGAPGLSEARASAQARDADGPDRHRRSEPKKCGVFPGGCGDWFGRCASC